MRILSLTYSVFAVFCLFLSSRLDQVYFFIEKCLLSVQNRLWLLPHYIVANSSFDLKAGTDLFLFFASSVSKKYIALHVRMGNNSNNNVFLNSFDGKRNVPNERRGEQTHELFNYFNRPEQSL